MRFVRRWAAVGHGGCGGRRAALPAQAALRSAHRPPAARGTKRDRDIRPSNPNPYPLENMIKNSLPEVPPRPRGLGPSLSGQRRSGASSPRTRSPEQFLPLLQTCTGGPEGYKRRLRCFCSSLDFSRRSIALLMLELHGGGTALCAGAGQRAWSAQVGAQLG